MTRLQALIDERNMSYTQVARPAGLQPRTVRMLATGETPYDNVSVGTLRRIAEALAVPLYDLMEEQAVHPGGREEQRASRLAAAIDTLMWPSSTSLYPSPVESAQPDELVTLSPDDFFEGMQPIDADRG